MKNQILIALISGLGFITILCSCTLKVGGQVSPDTKLESPPEIPAAFTAESSETIGWMLLYIVRHNETGKRYILVKTSSGVAIEEIK